MAPPGALARNPARISARISAVAASPTFFRRAAAFTLWSLGVGIVSGGAVRLTGSGLGCTDWPACTKTNVVAPLAYHAWVEFGNRLVEAALTVGIVLVALAAWRRRPRRADLLLVSGALVVGMFAEVVVGGEVVLHKLAPLWVMGHYWLSVALLVAAAVLWHRSGMAEVTAGQREGRAVAAPARCLVRPGQRLASRAMLGWTFVVVVLGTVVTSTGPHAGAPGVPRFHFFSLHRAAELHGSSADILVGLTVLTLVSMYRSRVDQAVLRRGEALLGLMVVQAGIGYTQYFTGDPVALVGLHIAGETTLVVTMCWFNFGLFVRQVPRARPSAMALEVSDAKAETLSELAQT